MAIGVKFCGGCNPTYDRTAEYVKLKKRYPDVIFETYDPSKKYEKIHNKTKQRTENQNHEISPQNA